MKSFAVFATVGTTSFDDLVESLCSLPFLTAMARRRPQHEHHSHRSRRRSRGRTERTSSRYASSRSSSRLRSARSSSSASSDLGQRGSSSSSSRSSSPARESSCDCADGGGGTDASSKSSTELTIQYGAGRCPLSFLPPILLGLASADARVDDDDEDGSGSIALSIPTHRARRRDGAASDYDDDDDDDDYDEDRGSHHRMLVRWYRFRPSLVSEMERADAILCHAGAGTLLEALEISASSSSSSSEARRRRGRTKIVNAVINPTLMDNHQSELAEELERRGHVHVTRDCTSEWTDEAGATKFWEDVGSRELAPFYLGGRRGRDNDGDHREPSGFQSLVDRVMGFDESWSEINSYKTG